MRNDIILSIREFNRFYTHLLGLLGRHLPNSSFSLSEARVIYEVAHQPAVTASILENILLLDKSYLSRLLLRLEHQKVITRKEAEDGRARTILLTAKGKKVFSEIDRSSSRQIADLVEGLPPADQKNLVFHLQSAQKLLVKKSK